MEETKLNSETLNAEIEMDNSPLTKIKVKRKSPSVPQSEKQKANFQKALEVRNENRRKAREAKEVKMAKIYMENKLKEQEKAEPKTEPKEEPVKKQPVKKTVKYVEEENDDEEEEIVYVKKKKPVKKKKIVYLSDSDDDGGDIPPPKLERQTNRVMRKEPEPQKPEPSVNYNDYFI